MLDKCRVANLHHGIGDAGDVVGASLGENDGVAGVALTVDILGGLGSGVDHSHAVVGPLKVVLEGEVECAGADVVILVPCGSDARVVAVLLHLSHGHIKFVAAPVIAVAGVIVGAALPIVLARCLEGTVGAVQEDGVKVAGIGERIGVDIGDRTGDDHHVLAINLIEVFATADLRLVAEKCLFTNRFHAIGDDNVARIHPAKTVHGNLGNVG